MTLILAAVLAAPPDMPPVDMRLTALENRMAVVESRLGVKSPVKVAACPCGIPSCQCGCATGGPCTCLQGKPVAAAPTVCTVDAYGRMVCTPSQQSSGFSAPQVVFTVTDDGSGSVCGPGGCGESSSGRRGLFGRRRR